MFTKLPLHFLSSVLQRTLLLTPPKFSPFLSSQNPKCRIPPGQIQTVPRLSAGEHLEDFFLTIPVPILQCV